MSVSTSERSAVGRYAISVATVMCAAGLQSLYNTGYGLGTPFILLYPAILISAWYGGLGPGVLVSIIGALTGALLFARPDAFAATPSLQVAAFAATSILACVLSESLHRARRRAADTAETLRAHLLAQSELEQTRAYLAAIVNSSEDAIISTTLEGRIRSWNPAAERLYGYTAAEVVGQSLALLIPPELPDEFPKVIASIQGGTRTEDYETLRVAKSGQRVSVSLRISPVLSPEGVLIGGSASARDVGERKRREEELRQVSADLQIVLDSMAAPVTRCSRDLRYIWVSRAYAAWLLRSPEEIAGRPIVDVVGEDALAAIRPHIERVLSGERVEYEAAVNFRGPGLRWIHAVYTPTHDTAGAVDGWVAVVIDVTERRAMEERLREEARRKDEFLAMLAHELRNPLAPIRNAIHLLRRPTVTEAQRIEVRDLIERQVAHLVRMVDDLLDVSRVTQGKIMLVKERLDVADLLNEAIETARPMIERQAQTLTVSVARARMYVAGDRTRLTQVFGNLLHNAAKFTPARGQITVTADGVQAEVSIRIRDNGVGIEPEMLSHVFDLFVQAAPGLARSTGGLGIGLTLVRQLVELHGGRVEARSQGRGQGSEFVVTLPATAPGRAITPSPSTAVRTATRPLHILIVEDNLDAAQSFAMLLQLDGHNISTATDGLTALEMAEKITPDVAFVDIGLPGLDGYEVVRQLRERPGWRSTIFVALSGYGRDEDRQRGREAGFDHHLIKPVDPADVEGLLAQLTAATPASTATPRTVH